jgi:glycosyltransferase involved in cell wall biosynthesis
MKLAAVGSCDDSASGREMADAIRQLPFTSVYLTSVGGLPRVDRVPISACYVPNRFGAQDMGRFIELHKPDVIVTWGRAVDPGFPVLWKERGIRWIHVVHSEWFDPWSGIFRTAGLISPNENCRRRLQELEVSSRLLAVPVDTDRFQFVKRTEARSFLTVYDQEEGADALSEIFLAWWEMENAPPLFLRSQEKPGEIDHCLPPETVTIETRKHREDFYRDGDVAVQLSAYQESWSSTLEALSSGLPVLTTSASPIPPVSPELQVAIEGTSTVPIGGRRITSLVSVRSLKERVKAFQGRDISDLSRRCRAFVEERYSWKALRGKWIEILK